MQRETLNVLREAANPNWHLRYLGRDENGKKQYTQKRVGLTDDMLELHLEEVDDAFGINVVRSGNRGRILVLDFDDHDGVHDDEAKRRVVSVVANWLMINSVPHAIFRSTGGKGYHIWIVFKRDQDQQRLFEFGCKILSGCSGKDGNREMAHLLPPDQSFVIGQDGLFQRDGTEHHVEIIPENSTTENDAVMLPFAGESVAMKVDGWTIRETDKPTIEIWDHDLTADETSDYADLTALTPSKDKERTKAKPRTNEQKPMNVEAAIDAFLTQCDVNKRTGKGIIAWKTAAMMLLAAFDGTEHETMAKVKWAHWSLTAEASVRDNQKQIEYQWDKTKVPEGFDTDGFWWTAHRGGYDGDSPVAIPETNMGKLIDFAERWALIDIEGKVRFLNRETGRIYGSDDWNMIVATEGKIPGRWLTWSKRKVYDGYVLEPLEYNGNGFNRFTGFPTVPKAGDAGPWVEYIRDVICGNASDAFHWVMTYLADIAQNPTMRAPGSALALKGEPGSGKSTLGEVMEEVIGEENTITFAGDDKFSDKFNDAMFGKPLVLGEETFFVGNERLTNALKQFITGKSWLYEQKYQPTFRGKNVHRIVSTTNSAHAVKLDNTDRRWTILEVTKVWDEAKFGEFRRWTTANRGVILKYLLDWKVDRELIRRPHMTAAKKEDIASSSPLAQFLAQCAETGIIPGDVRGDGVIVSATLAKEVNALADRHHQKATRALANQARREFGFDSVSGVPNVEWQQDRCQGELVGYTGVVVNTKPGLKFPPLPLLRSILTELADIEFPDDALDRWLPDTGPDVHVSFISNEARIAASDAAMGL